MVKKSSKRVKSKPSKKTTKKKITKKSRTSNSRMNRVGPKKSKNIKSKVAVKKKTKQTPTNPVHQDGAIVVRIMGQGQYRLDTTAAQKLNEIDNEIVKIVQSAPHEAGSDGLHNRFQKMLGEMTNLVTRKGKQVAASEIIPSDLILPPEDISIEGARELFQGEGLIPDSK